MASRLNIMIPNTLDICRALRGRKYKTERPDCNPTQLLLDRLVLLARGIDVYQEDVGNAMRGAPAPLIGSRRVHRYTDGFWMGAEFTPDAFFASFSSWGFLAKRSRPSLSNRCKLT